MNKMEKFMIVEIFKGIIVFSIIYIEQSRYESKANQILISDSDLISDTNNYNSQTKKNIRNCALYPKNLGSINFFSKSKMFNDV